MSNIDHVSSGTDALFEIHAKEGKWIRGLTFLTCSVPIVKVELTACSVKATCMWKVEFSLRCLT